MEPIFISNGETTFNLLDYPYIHACTINKDHIDFYKVAPVPGERGQPDIIFKYKDEAERDEIYAAFLDTLSDLNELHMLRLPHA